ncbi:MAG: hypothetical protein H6Q90_2319 [Deltaproteobacteria bacterium]|nr:hypothetical protein [Deltaproteobacteria bacterium]
MAGGPFAHAVPCMHCFDRAERTGEGLETDWYRCPAGHEFGVDWDAAGPPTSSRWPPSAAEIAEFERFRKLRGKSS